MNVFELTAELVLDTSKYNSALDGAGNKALSFGTMFGANLASAAVQKGIGLLVDGFNMIGSAISSNMDSAVSRLDTLNSYSKTMEALGFSTEQAIQAQDELKEAIEGLPTTLDGIISWQQQFTALTDDIEGSTDLTIALNNATLAAGKGQEAANNAMGNWYGIIAQGYPDAQKWQSIYSTMPAQMNQLAESILGVGAKSDDLYQAWKDGIVTTEDVTSALISLNEEGENGVASFAEQAQIGAQTIETAYGNINTAIGKNIAKVLEVINGDTTEGGGRIVELLLNVKDLINEIGDAITQFVSDHEPQITAIMDAINSILTGGDISSNLKTIADNVKPILSDIMTAVTEALPTVIEFAGSVVTVLLSALLDNAPAIIDAALQVITDLVTGLSNPDAIAQLTNTAVYLIDTLANGIAVALPVLLPAIMTIISTLVTTLSSPENVQLLVNAALVLLGGITVAILQSIPVYLQMLFGFIENVDQLFDVMFENLWALFVAGFTALFDIVGSWLGTIGGYIGEQANDFIQTFAAGSAVIVGFVIETFTSILDGVTSFGSELWDSFTSIFDNAVKIVSDSIDAIVGLFDFEWSLPDIKLPHFSVTGTLDLLADPPTYPSVSVDWYKKGYSDAYILNGATIFGAQGGSLLGAGEGSGSEVVVGTEKLISMMSEAVRSAMGSGQTIVIPVYFGTEKVDEIVVKSNQRNDYISGGR